MKLTGELKAKVESAAGMEEKKALIAEAGMELNDEELAAVAGGYAFPWICPFCGETIMLCNIKDTSNHMSICPKNPLKS